MGDTYTISREEYERLRTDSADLRELRGAVRNLLKAPHNSFNDAMWREKVKGLLPADEVQSS